MRKVLEDWSSHKFRSEVAAGGLSNLLFATNFAGRVVEAAKKQGKSETLSAGRSLYRARRDYFEEFQEPEIDEDGGVSGGNLYIGPLAGSEMGAPPSDRATLGRFNVRLHPALYMATTPEVALAEVRASAGEVCTVAQFQAVRDTQVAVLLDHKKHPIQVYFDDEPKADDLEKYLLAEVSQFVSQRPADDDIELHYRCCNLIASAFKEAGFDGLVYLTSFWSPIWSDVEKGGRQGAALSSNIVFFDPAIAVASKTWCASVEYPRPKCEWVGGSGIWQSTKD